jgi:hypothetical protein
VVLVVEPVVLVGQQKHLDLVLQIKVSMEELTFHREVSDLPLVVVEPVQLEATQAQTKPEMVELELVLL